MKRKSLCIIMSILMMAAMTQGCTSQKGEATSQSMTSETEQLNVADADFQETEVAEAESTETADTARVLAAENATISGQGINSESETVDTVYVSDLHAVTNFGTNSEICYTVPEDVDGTFDIYVDYGKSPFACGTTQASLIVNNDKEYILPAAIESCASDYSDLFSMGKFLMAENVTLKSGDTLTVHGKAGFETEYNGNKVSSMTAVGDLYLYESGTPVAVGYDGGTVPEAEKADESDPLSGKTLVWLGSSVTFGMQSGGYSMADALSDAHADTTCLKYAISGTTLVNEDMSSYVERMKEIDPDMEMDAFVVQLSTNDATAGKPLGEISDSRDLESFDDTTVLGAIEYIIAYAENTWDCPVVFYTGTYYESTEYQAMVEALKQVQDKWDIGIVDLWDNEDMTALYGTEQYNSYMSDEIHPNRDGYVKWWTPEFETYFTELFAE